MRRAVARPVTSLARRMAAGVLILLVALACNLGAAATPTPAPLGSPLLTVQPVTGAPGTLITLHGVGFAPNVSLNLYLNSTNSQGSPFAAVRTDASGDVITTLTLPDSFGGVTFGDGQPIVFSLTSANGASTAKALFLVEGTGTPAAAIAPIGSNATAFPSQPTAAGQASGVFITQPGINAVLTDPSVTVSGSAPAGAVLVEVQDSNNVIIARGQATSIMQPGQVTGTWQTTVAFPQPATSAQGFIVALAAGEQASIPVTFSGSTIPSLTVPTLQIIATP